MLNINGSTGGGQLLRTALSLSAITQKSFKIVDIRGKREKPGLRRQHLTAVNAVAKVCNAKLTGNELGSTELEFYPSSIKPGRYKFDIGTAGSTTLVLQTLLPILSLAHKQSEIEIIGGTANPLAPPAFELKEVFLYHLEKIGIYPKLDIKREGFYSKEGHVKLNINPAKEIKPLYLIERGQLNQINVYAVASETLKNADVAERMIKGFRKGLDLEYKLVCSKDYVETISTGCYITAVAEFANTRLGYTSLGERGKKAEDIGRECFEALMKEINSGATIDRHTADQLLIYIGLAKEGRILTSGITEHIQTNIKVIEQFLDARFDIKGNLIQVL
ncbi:RNA 3'-phosphate cyclase [archaeon]|nr:RNA 3'-phosphate cyclase [archaeon]